MLNKEHKEYIRSRLGEPELLGQLAEEAAELTQAALKLRRAITGINPTPVSTQDALKAYQEEIADVLLCLGMLEFDPKIADTDGIMERKLQRWVTRLKEHDNAEPFCPKDGGYCNDAHTGACGADCGGTLA